MNTAMRHSRAEVDLNDLISASDTAAEVVNEADGNLASAEEDLRDAQSAVEEAQKTLEEATQALSEALPEYKDWKASLDSSWREYLDARNEALRAGASPDELFEPDMTSEYGKTLR